jgi:amino acid adenylation domain-containing protein/non-ribosomal peptide synthase protein (TIGR01720 family)
MENIEDLYVASPMQRGLIFHSLYAPETSDYFVQAVYDLQGELDFTIFERVWRRILDRYSILRTSFIWEELDEALQVVHKQLPLPWRNNDWRELSSIEQRARFKEFIEEDRRLKLDLSEAPLMRMTLIRLGDRQWKFVWSHHHLLLDGWSAFVILKEAFNLYQAFVSGREPELVPVRSYRDYIAWLEHRDRAADKRYWSAQLGGYVNSTLLTGGRQPESQLAQHTAGADRQSGREDAYLSAEATAALKLVARRSQFTLNTIMQGAWALLLSRYSGEEDVAFGIVVSGRPPELNGVEEMVGPFINLLPLRVRIEGGRRLTEWLKALQESQAEMREYEYNSLAEIQEWSEVPRGQPLFESIMSFHNYPIDASFQEHEVKLRVTKVSSIEKTNYPLSLNVMPGAELHLQLSYDAAYFDGESARRMLSHFEKILGEVAARPDMRLCELSLLTEKDARQLLQEWNRTRADYSAQQLVFQLFEAQAQRAPFAIAMASEETALSYGELNRRANQVAHYLRKLNVGPEAVVGVIMERSVEMAIALLGILKAGGVYLPIDPAYPRQRQMWMLEDSGARVLMTKEWELDGFPDYRGHWVSFEILGDLIAAESAWNPDAETIPDNLAYLIYTSGSTGHPKGVAVSHRSLLNLIFWHHRNYQVTSSDRATQLAGVGFDASAWELWPYLAGGASAHLPSDDIRNSPASLRDWMIEQSITISFLPTPLAEQILFVDWPKEAPLRALLTGGDRLHHYPSDSLPFRLFNNYGPTEHTVVATSGLVELQPAGDRLPSIGRPIDNTEIYMLDAHLQPAPVGVAGEICIGGNSLARGYLGHPELTADRFIPHPFALNGEGRLYRTGDVGRYLSNGEIEFIGRRDDQVKVRGFRIELGEIEAVLRRHPSLREAVAALQDQVAEHKQLVAYVVAAQRPGPGEIELREYLRRRLPEYMIPSAIVTLEALPLTTNGKVDRRRLPRPETGRTEGGGQYVAARTIEEQTLIDIWQQVLGRPQVGIHDNFFDLGGDSILSIQIVARANRAGLRLSPKLLFDHPTVAGLSTVADRASVNAHEDETITGDVALTPIQRMFFKWKIVDRNHYNQAVMLKLRIGTDVERLKSVLQHLIEYHDGLRLRFTQEDTEWKAYYVPSDQLSFERVDLRRIEDAGARTAAIEEIAAATQPTVDIRQGPMMRVVYFDCGEHEPARLLVVIQHLTVDGVSWRILLDDLQRGYEQLQRGEPLDLGPKTTSFRRWATELIEQAQSPDRRREVDYWTLQPWDRACLLPLDGRGDDLTTGSARSLRVSLTVEETHALLREVPEAYHTQINEVLMTALGRAVGAWIGEGYVVVDMEGHGREEVVEGVDLSKTLGWFTAIFPILLRTSVEEEIGDALKRVKEQLRRVPQHGIGFGMLKYLSNDEAIRTEMRAIPGAQLNFNYLGQFDQVADTDAVIRGADESCGPAQSSKNPLPTLITINSTVHGGRLEMVWTYSQEAHRSETAERLAERYMEELRNIIEHCRSPEAGGFTLSDFPLSGLDEEEFGQLSTLISELSVR